MNRSIGCTLMVLLTISTVAVGQDNLTPTSAPATQPAVTEWTLPQDDDIYVLLPAGDKIYYLCADRNKEAPSAPSDIPPTCASTRRSAACPTCC